MKTKPLYYQTDAYNKGKDADLFALLADMGVGKTKIAIDICDYKHTIGVCDRVLVIAPSGVHGQWLNEQYPAHCSHEYEGFLYKSNSTLKFVRALDSFLWRAKESTKLLVMSMNIEAFTQTKGIDLASRFLDTAIQGCAILIDEASIIKTPDIVTVKNVKKLRDRYATAFRCVLTGTPAAKGPINMWSIFDFLKKNYMGCSYVVFRMTHTVIFTKSLRIKGRLVNIKDDLTRDIFDKVKLHIRNNSKDGDIQEDAVEYIRNKFGLSYNNFWIIANSKEFVRYKNLDRIHARIAPDTFSIKKSDCLDLPPKTYQVIDFKLNAHQKELIHNLEKYAVATYQGEELTLEIRAMLGLRVLQICGGFFAHHTDIEGIFDTKPVEGVNAKLEYIKKDLVEVGFQQSIIWSVYTKEIELIYNTLKEDYSVGMLYGGVVDDAREEVVTKFKSGEIQHLISNPAVGGFGYNFQNATVQYWYSRNYRTELRIQAEDRIYRIGTKVSPVYKDLLYSIPLERKVLDTLKAEQEINEVFISQRTTSEVYNEANRQPLAYATLEDIFRIK